MSGNQTLNSKLAKNQKKLLKLLKGSLFMGNQNSGTFEALNFEDANEAIKAIILVRNNLGFRGNQAIKYALLAGQFLIKYKELCLVENKKYLTFLHESGISWKKSYVNFLIAFYNFSKYYPKIIKISLSIHYVLNHFKDIRAAISSSDEEKNFWKGL